MPRIPYYDADILLAIPRFGERTEDIARLELLAPLFRENAQATVAECLEKLFPEKPEKQAVAAFKSFCSRLEKAGRSADPPLDIKFVRDENRRLGSARRFCRIEGPPLAPPIRSLVDDVRRLPDVPNPAYLGKPKVRLVPLYRPHDNRDAHHLRELLENNLQAHQTIDFQIVDHPEQADLLLPLLSNEFLGDDMLLEHVRDWSLEKPVVPVGLEPFAESQADGSFDAIQQFRLRNGNGRQLSFSECRTAQQRDAFALELYEEIVTLVRAAFARGTWKTGLDWLGEWSEAQARNLLTEDRLVSSPAKRMAMHATVATERPVEFAADGDATELLCQWAVDPKASHYLAVLGEYGIGKTTSLKRFTLELERRRKDDPTLPVAIYLDLRNGAAGTPADATLEEILRRILDKTPMEGPKQTPRALLDAVQKFGAVLIFDGLDERVVHMTSAQADEFIRQLFHALPPSLLAPFPPRGGRAGDGGDASRGTTETPPPPTPPPSRGRGELKQHGRPGKLIISCRSHYFRTLGEQYAMLTGRDREGFRKGDCEALIILPFGEEQIRAYIDKALHLDGKDPERVETVIKLFASIHNLSEMAPRPVLLSMLVEQIDDLQRLQIETRRPLAAVDLYDRMVERWLERDGGKHKLKPDHKRRIMEGLAAFLWREGVKEIAIERLDDWFLQLFAEDDNLRTRAQLDGFNADMLEGDLRTGTFLVRPDSEAQRFRFAHTSFQEYFLARYLLRALHNGKPERWDLPMPSIETLDFLGVLLARGVEGGEWRVEGKESRDTAHPSVTLHSPLSTLHSILGGSTLPAALIAFRYWVRAIERGYPTPNPQHVNLSKANLEEWTIQGCAPHDRLTTKSPLPLDGGGVGGGGASGGGDGNQNEQKQGVVRASDPTTSNDAPPPSPALPPPGGKGEGVFAHHSTCAGPISPAPNSTARGSNTSISPAPTSPASQHGRPCSSTSPPPPPIWNKPTSRE